MSHRSWITCVVATLSLVLLPPALARADTFNLDVGVVGNGVVADHGYNCGVGVQTPVCSQAGWVTGNKLTLAAAPGAAPGWRFDHWSFSGNFTVCADGNVSSTTVNPCTFDMPATCICNRFVSITAVFVRSGQPTTSLSGGPAQGATVGRAAIRSPSARRPAPRSSAGRGAPPRWLRRWARARARGR